MREVKFENGAVLRIAPAKFSAAKELYQALLVELRAIPIGTKTEMGAIFKDMFCAGFSSKHVEACLAECMKVCTYQGDASKGALKIDDDTFEAVAQRENYVAVCAEVTKENVFPFMKSLYAEFQKAQSMIESTPG